MLDMERLDIHMSDIRRLDNRRSDKLRSTIRESRCVAIILHNKAENKKSKDNF